MLSTGSRGAVVTTLQVALNAQPSVNPKVSVDGIYGQKTVNAVRQFQTASGIFPSGNADAEVTQPRLYARAATTAASAQNTYSWDWLFNSGGLFGNTAPATTIPNSGGSNLNLGLPTTIYAPPAASSIPGGEIPAGTNFEWTMHGGMSLLSGSMTSGTARLQLEGALAAAGFKGAGVRDLSSFPYLTFSFIASGKTTRSYAQATALVAALTQAASQVGITVAASTVAVGGAAGSRSPFDLGGGESSNSLYLIAGVLLVIAIALRK